MSDEHGISQGSLLAEFARQALVRPSADIGPGDQEYSCTLFARTAREVEIRLYAERPEDIDRDVIPALRELLAAMDEGKFPVEREDAYLAKILLRRDGLGLHYWEHDVNNEFTVLFEQEQGEWKARGYGQFFELNGFETRERK